MAQDDTVLAMGGVGRATVMRIYRDGTFTVASPFGRESGRDRLLGFDHDADSMRRKSASGRGLALMASGGLSALASNNRGVIYVTIIGAECGVLTYTTRNPDGSLLTAVRSLKAAADAVLVQGAPALVQPPPAMRPTPEQPSEPGLPAQLQQLADLHLAGALTSEEFDAAKARLLDFD